MHGPAVPIVDLEPVAGRLGCSVGGRLFLARECPRGSELLVDDMDTATGGAIVVVRSVCEDLLGFEPADLDETELVRVRIVVRFVREDFLGTDLLGADLDSAAALVAATGGGIVLVLCLVRKDLRAVLRCAREDFRGFGADLDSAATLGAATSGRIVVVLRSVREDLLGADLDTAAALDAALGGRIVVLRFMGEDFCGFGADLDSAATLSTATSGGIVVVLHFVREDFLCSEILVADLDNAHVEPLSRT
jgi:hypothetical protein